MQLRSLAHMKFVKQVYKQGIMLGHVAGELMAIESWMDFAF